jgi:hypothetical protein
MEKANERKKNKALYIYKDNMHITNSLQLNMATETVNTLAIQNLQNQTIELLEQCKTTIQNVNQLLNKHQKQSDVINNTETDFSDQEPVEHVASTGSNENTSTCSQPDAYSLDSIIKILDLEIKAVKNIQLRMAIVGTMKAGRFIFISNTAVSYFIEVKD